MNKWYIPDAYWRTEGTGNSPSHEAVCVLNTTDTNTTVMLTLYFENREPMDGFSIKLDARRTLHIRMDKLKNKDGFPVPADIPYAILIECPEIIQIQYTRVDTSQKEMAIATTIV